MQKFRWTNLFLDKTCANNQIRVKYPESAAPDVANDTRSEGIGYGMPLPTITSFIFFMPYSKRPGLPIALQAMCQR